jgi:hypothetical protein
MRQAAPQPSRHSTLRALVLHPVIVSALAIWLFNDHVLKRWFSSWWTGKLSDVVALVAGPVVLAGLWCLATRRPQHIRSAVTIAAATLALVMVLINTWPAAGVAYCWMLGAAQWPFRWLWAWALGEPSPMLAPVYLVMDASDLLTLPAALVAPWLAKRL